MKKLLILLFAFLITITTIFAGATTDNSIIWDITINKYETRDKLHTTIPVTQYDRSVVNVDYDNVPASDNVYMLIDMEVKKSKGGNQPFVWKNLYLTDNQGNKVSRMENDVFLQDHGFARMRGDDLKLGKNSGVACFEIPKDMGDKPLDLVYENNGEKKVVKVK